MRKTVAIAVAVFGLYPRNLPAADSALKPLISAVQAESSKNGAVGQVCGDVRDCGLLTLGSDARSFNSCVKKAIKEPVCFSGVVEKQGVDSRIGFGFSGGSETFVLFSFDSDGGNENVSQIVCPHTQFKFVKGKLIVACEWVLPQSASN